MCHPTTTAPLSESGGLGPTHRVASRGRGGIGDLGRGADVSSPPLYPHTPNSPHLSPPPFPILTELPLGLAHGPRTPGPLEETVCGPWGEARGRTAPHPAPRAPSKARRRRLMTG